MKVILIGDACLDVFVEGECYRLSPEAPVAVLNPTRETVTGGMGCNVLANLESLAPNMVVDALLPNYKPRKIRYVDRKTSHHFVRVDEPDAAMPISAGHLFQSLYLGPPDAFLISDYAKGAVTEELIASVGEYCREGLIPWFLDTKRILGPWAKGAILKINRLELETNLSAGVRPWEHVSACIVTNGALGMDLYGPSGEISHHVQGPVVEVRDGAGCGDTVLAALVVAYLENGFDLKGAMAWADKAGRVAVSKRGVVAVRREEVR